MNISDISLLVVTSLFVFMIMRSVIHIDYIKFIINTIIGAILTSYSFKYLGDNYTFTLIFFYTMYLIVDSTGIIKYFKKGKLK